MRTTLTEQVNLRMSRALPRLVSQGYAFVGDTKVFVRVYHVPACNCYLVKVKLPKHKTLHLWWPGADWGFEYDWLTFTVCLVDVTARTYLDGWDMVRHAIQHTLKSVSFD